MSLSRTGAKLHVVVGASRIQGRVNEIDSNGLRIVDQIKQDTTMSLSYWTEVSFIFISEVGNTWA